VCGLSRRWQPDGRKLGAPVGDGGQLRVENRRYLRHPVTCELRGKALKPLERVGESFTSGRDLRGVVTDISLGGLGLLSDDAVEVFKPFVCEIIAPPLPTGIPTLMQIRWILKEGQGQTYRMGLQFMVEVN
jgi:c-di-GMP-binding flagellar brake protein YcgR